MSDFNKVWLIGRLTRDAEIKYTNTGTAVSNFSVACNEKYKSGGQMKEVVSFFDIVLWGKYAEALQRHLTKGKQIGVVGSLRQERWEIDGYKKSKIHIIAESVKLLGGAKNSKQGFQQANQEPQGVQTNDPDDEFEDDIPF